MAAGGPDLSGAVEHGLRWHGAAAGHTGERVTAGDPHYILRLVHRVVTTPYITGEGVMLGRSCLYSHHRASGGAEGENMCIPTIAPIMPPQSDLNTNSLPLSTLR